MKVDHVLEFCNASLIKDLVETGNDSYGACRYAGDEFCCVYILTINNSIIWPVVVEIPQYFLKQLESGIATPVGAGKYYPRTYARMVVGKAKKVSVKRFTVTNIAE